MSDSEFRKIALVDLDAYFCSAETLKDPSLKHKPFAVGGKSGRGVLSTANYLARQFGIGSAMPAKKALQLCPDLVIVGSDMPFYKALSTQVKDILLSYTPHVEQASIDEFYLGLTDNKRFSGSASLTVQAIRQEIAQLGITASAGISNLRMVAKIASDDNKPNGQTLVSPDDVLCYLAKLPLKRIPGVGKVTLAKLHQAGYKTGRDIQRTDERRLVPVLGEKFARVLIDRCNGIDPRGINTDSTRKSIAAEITLERDIKQLEQAQQILEQNILPKFIERYKKADQQYKIKNQTVKLKFNDFAITTVSQQSPQYDAELFQQLLTQAWQRAKGRAVRLIGVGVAVEPIDVQADNQLDLF